MVLFLRKMPRSCLRHRKDGVEGGCVEGRVVPRSRASPESRWRCGVSLLCNRCRTPRKITPLLSLRLTFRAFSRLTNLNRSFDWESWYISCPFGFSFASEIYAMKKCMHAQLTESSTQWKPRWCLSFKVLLSRDRGLDIGYTIWYTTRMDLCLPSSLLGSESYLSVYAWYLNLGNTISLFPNIVCFVFCIPFLIIKERINIVLIRT